MTSPLPDFREDYLALVQRLQSTLPREHAAAVAVGGEFVAMGTLEHQLLRQLGLGDGHAVVDIGCGSGRLAAQLTRYPTLQYLGTDVVPDLLTYAAALCRRADWRFEVANGFTIPAPTSTADFVCFFSVFTHLLHDQSYRYLRDAARVLRPGGRIVFSFLEFRVRSHWSAFAATLAGSPVLNQFLDRDAISLWAETLGLTVERFAAGDWPHIPLDEPLVFESGQRVERLGTLGQSVAVLQKPG